MEKNNKRIEYRNEDGRNNGCSIVLFIYQGFNLLKK